MYSNLDDLIKSFIFGCNIQGIGRFPVLDMSGLDFQVETSKVKQIDKTVKTTVIDGFNYPEISMMIVIGRKESMVDVWKRKIHQVLYNPQGMQDRQSLWRNIWIHLLGEKKQIIKQVRFEHALLTGYKTSKLSSLQSALWTAELTFDHEGWDWE